jgi:tRNA threonylcarbamoyladenosine biosynthesis protein TsaB
MRLIALETATEACSAALWVDGEIHWQIEREASRRHGELILQQVDQLLTDAGLRPGDLDAIAAGRGPGAFTGVRLGLGVAQGLAFAIGCPVVPVSTLSALAQQAFDRGGDQVMALLDARMGEVYWSLSTRDARGLVQWGEERLSRPEEIGADRVSGRRFALGSGVPACAMALAASGFSAAELDASAIPRAREIAALGAAAFLRGEAVSPDRAQPVYLRDRVAVPSRSPVPTGGAHR